VDFGNQEEVDFYWEKPVNASSLNNAVGLPIDLESPGQSFAGVSWNLSVIAVQTKYRLFGHHDENG
jgi:hypothetical protein